MPTKQETLQRKARMADSLLQLMQSAPPQKITAQQIAQQAGVGRATWFRAFGSKQEALEFKIVNDWRIWCETRAVSYPVKADRAEVLEFFRFHYHMRETYRLLCRYGMQSVLLGAFHRVVSEVSELHQGDAASVYSASFYSYGMMGLLETWISRNFQDTPEQLLALVQNVLQRGSLQ